MKCEEIGSNSKGNRAEKALNITLLVINQKGSSAPHSPSSLSSEFKFIFLPVAHIYIEVLSAKGLKSENVSI